MRVAIIGTREKFIAHPVWWKRCVYRYVQKILRPDDVVISGGAAGADLWSVAAARDRGLQVKEFLPDYAKHGRGAPFARNWQIVADCHTLVAFWDRTSKGTLHTINAARSENKQVTIINPEDPEEHIPVWWIEPADYAF